MSSRRLSSRAGLSLLELVVGLTMLGTFLGSLLLVASEGARSAQDGMARQTIEARARRTLDLLARELACAGPLSLDPDPVAPWGSDHVTFQRISGYDAGAVQWDAPASFSLELEPDELDDGLDNNGNGLVDERVLVLTRDVGGADEHVVLAHGIRELLEGELPNGLDDNGNGLRDEAGLSFQRIGKTLHVRLTFEEPDARGSTTVRSVTTGIHLRN